VLTAREDKYSEEEDMEEQPQPEDIEQSLFILWAALIVVSIIVHTLDYLKSSLNVQITVSADQSLAFFAKITYLFANRFSHLENTG
jgi:hypothetical protein